MKICLIKPIGSRWEEEQFWIDIGLGYLGTSLKRSGNDVEIIDTMAKKMSWKRFDKYLQRNKCDLYCFKTYSGSVNSVKESIKIIKKYNNKALIGVGGPHPSGVGGEIFDHIPEADFAWQGEAELWLPKFIERIESTVDTQRSKINMEPGFILNDDYFNGVPGLIYRSPEGVTPNKPYFHENLDEFGYPDLELMNMENYINSKNPRFGFNHYIPVMTSRGCPKPCTYCAAHKITGKKIRRHSIEYVVGWIEQIQKKFNMNYFAFVDDALLSDRDYFGGLLEEILRRDMKIKWDCAQNAVQFDQLDEDLIKLMEKTGCYFITVAIESGSEKTLKAMKRPVNLELAKRKVELIKDTANIQVGAFFILGFPNEDWEDLKATTKLSRSLPIDAINYFLYTPHPGTEMYEKLKREGKLTKVDWSKWNYWKGTLSLPKISINTIRIYRQWSHIRFEISRKSSNKIRYIDLPFKFNWLEGLLYFFKGRIRDLIG